MNRAIRIATRGSQLARWQAGHAAELLQPLISRPIELVLIRTQGDAVADRPLTAIAGVGVFTKEVQQAVLERRADLAVHSLKDLPTEPADGLTLAAVLRRGPAADVLISTRHGGFQQLPNGARIGSSSPRRRAILLYRRPDLNIVDLRGNVETRLRKLREQDLDGIILAQAGIERLGRADEITEILDPHWMLPAVGQGALALECRSDDLELRTLLQTLNHWETYCAVTAERAFLRALGGGCLLPIAAYGRSEGVQLHLRGGLYSPDGKSALTCEIEGMLPATGGYDEAVSGAEAVGRQLAGKFFAQGARMLLDAAAGLAGGSQGSAGKPDSS